MTRIRRRRLAATAALAATLACGRETPSKKRELVRLPFAVAPHTVVLADDGERWAYVESVSGGQRVVTAAGRDETHRECYRPLFAPHTGRLLYWARDGKENAGGIVLVADGKVVGDGYAEPGTIVFDRSGSHWAAIAPVPSPTGEGPQRVALIADGKEVDRTHDASVPTYGPDGRHLAYFVESEGGQIALAVDGETRTTGVTPDHHCAQKSDARPGGRNLPLQFVARYLGDGSLVALGQEKDGWVVSRDGTRLAVYTVNVGDPRVAQAPVVLAECEQESAIAPATFNVADEAPVVVWWERLPGASTRWRVVHNGTPVDDAVCGSYWDDPPPQLSADGQHVAYPCTSVDPQHPDYIWVMKDGQRFGPHRDVWGMGFSDDGTHFVYDARTMDETETWSVYRDGVQLRGRYGALWRPRPSKSATHVAWQAQETRNPAGTGILVLDGIRISAFDEILWGPTFTSDRAVEWVFRRARRVIRLAVPLR